MSSLNTEVKEGMGTEPRIEWARGWIAAEPGLLVGGALLRAKGAEAFAVSDPATGLVLGHLPDCSRADVDRAVAAAARAFAPEAPWRRLALRERGETLRRIAALIRAHAAELATLETLCNGKTWRESFNDDLPETAAVFDYYAGWTDKIYGETCPVGDGFLNYTRRESVGVCALIVPWNFPLLLAAWKLGPALAMGNTVVVKPAPYTSYSMLRLAELIHEAELLPPGVLNVVTGDHIAGEALSHHPDVAKISFTGSTAVGRRVLNGSAASNLKAVTLELGGKSPNLLFADTPNVEGAIERSFTAMFSHKGEKCSEPTRLLVERPLYEDTIARLADLAGRVRLGQPFDPDSDQGPQCHRGHFDRILSYIDLGKREGARLVAGGHAERTAACRDGYFIRPTIFADVDPGSRVAQEEIFGPVLAVIPFSGEEEAVAIANATSYGLAAGLYTADSCRAHRIANRLDAGMVFVNHYGCYDFASPFGGFRTSGWGKEMARHSLDSYTKLKSIWIKY